jgi:AraC family transcriptional regulator of adaptative response / DNA-3-methyladenine glycosylase II
MEALSAVVTTGIYCRRGCSARPRPDNVRRFTLAAAAEAAGYRACLRCRPYRSPQPVEWAGPELVCRAVQLILDGVLDSGSEVDLGARLGVSARHLRRLFMTHLGVTPDQLARSRRAHFARRLLDDTDLAITDVAFASGFGSVRQLNRASQEIFRASPRQLRSRRRASDRLVADGGLVLRLPFSGPLDWHAMLDYFAARAIPGVEHVSGDVYRRTIVVEGDPGVLELSSGGPDHLVLRAHLPHWEGLIHIVERARRIFSLDAPVDEAISHLSRDPVIGELVTRRPGRRVPGTWDPFETGVRAIVGQHVSVPHATTIIGRLVRKYGEPLPGLRPFGLSHTFPTSQRLARSDLSGVGLTATRAGAIEDFADAVESGAVRLDRSVTLDEFVRSVTDIRGLGPWSAHYLALRLGERDAFPADDLGLRRSLTCPAQALNTTIEDLARRWSPWRASVAVQLWLVENDGCIEQGASI